jgi:UDP-N-acetylglucosamine-lysosomal-enzyme
MQNLWPKEFDTTSSNKLRSGDDMQFAFSYFYYMMHERIPYDFDNVWDTFLDKDGDGYVFF